LYGSEIQDGHYHRTLFNIIMDPNAIKSSMYFLF